MLWFWKHLLDPKSNEFFLNIHDIQITTNVAKTVVDTKFIMLYVEKNEKFIKLFEYDINTKKFCWIYHICKM